MVERIHLYFLNALRDFDVFDFRLTETFFFEFFNAFSQDDSRFPPAFTKYATLYFLNASRYHYFFDNGVHKALCSDAF